METFDVRARITELIRQRGMKNSEMAAFLGVERRTVANWSNHQRAFNSDWLLAACHVLDVTPNEFFDSELHRKPESPEQALARYQGEDAKVLMANISKLREQLFLMELALRTKENGSKPLMEQAFKQCQDS